MNRKLRIMHLLRDVTHSGGLCWRETDDYTYEAQSGNSDFMITFKIPMMATGEGLDHDVAEVRLPALTLTFYNGTEGFDLTLETISGATSERRRGYKLFLQKAEETIKLLEEMLPPSSETHVRPGR